MTQDLIRYDLLVQDAMRKVIGNVLSDIAKDGLPGEHHFYVTFKTTAPGVRLSTRMREQYPEEMMIALQHQFWDLTVTDKYFEVGLSFSGVTEKLHVPLDAITMFYDPSVQFALTFQPQSTLGAEDEFLPEELLHFENDLEVSSKAKNKKTTEKPTSSKPTLITKEPTKRTSAKKKTAPAVVETALNSPQEKPKKETPTAKPDQNTARQNNDKTVQPLVKPTPAASPASTHASPPAPIQEKQSKAEKQTKETPDAGAKVVSLDAFRKKT